MGRISCLAFATLLWWSICAGADLAGRASVIDGDTLEIHGQRIRLHGIDAPESQQTCDARGKTYRCGQEAALALADHIGQQTVDCEQRDTDRYGRIVAICRIGREDLSAWLVSQGWALAYVRYSRDYVSEETTARAAKRGIWRGTFMPPWSWRGRGADTTTDQPQSAATCCKVCTTGKACGNSISRSKTCHKPPGCACDARWPSEPRRQGMSPDEELAQKRVEHFKARLNAGLELRRATAAFEHEALRPLFLLNGGAVVAMLTLYGSLVASSGGFTAEIVGSRIVWAI